MYHRAASHRGFTLVEMMIVVAVIGIGGTVAVVNMAEQVAEARAHADAQAMFQRIRQEHRDNKERMTGLVLHASNELGTGPNNVLVFEEAINCQAIPAALPRTIHFLATTSLNIDGSKMCWNAQGEPDNGAVPDTGGGVKAGHASHGPNVPENFTTTLLANTMNISAGIKRVVTTPITVSKTGLSSTPPVTASDAVVPTVLSGPPTAPNIPISPNPQVPSSP